MKPYIVWQNKQGETFRNELIRRAKEKAAQYRIPLDAKQWEKRAQEIRDTLTARFQLQQNNHPVEFTLHREIYREKYRVQPVSFSNHEGGIITGTLYVPHGDGPFPAMLNVHGHWANGKFAERVQARGHVQAANGIVALVLDAPGSGERSVDEKEYCYHGGMVGGGMFLTGEGLVAQQVRDNMRGVDLLSQLDFVDANKIGVTGASGGGNQSMWVAALDKRIKLCVPVVSVGSFQAYVGESNCVCETVVGGLDICEEWELLGLIAPNPLLIINAILDVPSFGAEPMWQTCQSVSEVYDRLGERQKFDYRLMQLTHGYWPIMQEAMVGWVMHHFRGMGSGTPTALPEWKACQEAELTCFPWGKREGASLLTLKEKELAKVTGAARNLPKQEGLTVERFKALVGRKKSMEQVPAGTWSEPDSRGWVRGIIASRTGVDIPVIYHIKNPEAELVFHLPLNGKESIGEKLEAHENWITLDLPGIGELEWGRNPIGGAQFHNSQRACFWVGTTLAGVWSEVIAEVLLWINQKFPERKSPVRVIAEAECGLGVLTAQIIDPIPAINFEWENKIKSFTEVFALREGSFAWIIPGILKYGDLDDLERMRKM